MPPKKEKKSVKKSVKKRKTNDSYAFWIKAANISRKIADTIAIGTVLSIISTRAIIHMIDLNRRRSEIQRIFPDGLRGAIRENIEDELLQ